MANLLRRAPRHGLAFMFRLPDGWSSTERFEDLTVADGLVMERVGLVTTSALGREVTGSAARVAGRMGLPPAERASFELLERVATFTAIEAPARSWMRVDRAGREVGRATSDEIFPVSSEPARWAFSRSNGVALHGSWDDACERAFLELAERDRVMAAWEGAVTPVLRNAEAVFYSSQVYRWLLAMLPPERDAFSSEIAVAVVLGLPLHASAPLILGSAGRRSEPAAIEAARDEAFQALAFLWGESFEPLPAFSPSADYHLEALQMRGKAEVLERWLTEGHSRYAAARREVRPGPVTFVDLTPPWLSEGLRVAKAACEGARPLVFGDDPSLAKLPAELRTHPLA